MENQNDNNSWAVYETNVQAYRSNFLLSQSLLLAAAAIMFEKSNIIFIIITAIALFQMWYIWFRVIVSRIYIVDYHKFSLYRYFDNSGNQIAKPSASSLKEKTYASNVAVRKLVNKQIPNIPELNISRKPGMSFVNIRMSRFKIDVLIPISITSIWIAFLVVFAIEVS